MLTFYLVSSLLCTALGCATLVAIVLLTVQIRRLNRTRRDLQHLERLYISMTQEFVNMVDSMILQDPEGVAIFYAKVHELSRRFLAVGKEKPTKDAVVDG